MTLVKICGITSPADAVKTLELGADLIGMVYYPPSPRHVNETQIADILDAVSGYSVSLKTVLVVVDVVPQHIDERIDYVQLHGDWNIKLTIDNGVNNTQTLSRNCIYVVKQLSDSVRCPLPAVKNPLFLLELSRGRLPGGNGSSWDWNIAKTFCKQHQTLIAGGINADNVQEVISLLRPYGVDVSSGAEISPAVKDFDKIKRIIAAVKEQTSKSTKISSDIP